MGWTDRQMDVAKDVRPLGRPNYRWCLSSRETWRSLVFTFPVLLVHHLQ